MSKILKLAALADKYPIQYYSVCFVIGMTVAFILTQTGVTSK